MSDNNSPSESATDAVIIYGSSWCPFTVRALQWLDAWKVDFKWVDVDAEPEAEQKIADWNGGRAIRPTFDISGVIMVNPEQSELKRELDARSLIGA